MRRQELQFGNSSVGFRPSPDLQFARESAGFSIREDGMPAKLPAILRLPA
jgi:hypothetical protein